MITSLREEVNCMKNRVEPAGFGDAVASALEDGILEILSDLEVECPECGRPMPVAPGVCECPHCGEKFEVSMEA